MPRIQKILAGLGVASRRNVEAMIRQGRVAVNGKVVMDLPILIDPRHDKIQVDGEPVHLSPGHDAPRIYILLNKPKRVYATNTAQGEQIRALDLLPRDLPVRVYPVGRLEADAKGLLLFTNDGDLTHRLTHPRFGVPKTYRAVVSGSISPQAMHALSRSVRFSDEPESPTSSRSFVKIIKRSREMTIVEITIREGRSAHIRRLLSQVGYKIRELTRIKFGPLTLEGLPPGKSRPLTAKEIARLRAMTSKEDSSP
jgi:23S rRNA pseudouridine2605 synthase